ncbi:hypothetical protein [Brevundimonas diminuta]|uniref:hypothetical protein n=1 Tax=Brevundimonas diminuta TaxID=293 RepID=UPI003D3350EC
MSMIDPTSPWWNRPSLRRQFGWVCWSAAVVTAFITGWSGAQGAIPGDVDFLSLQDASGIGLSIGIGLLLAGGPAYASGVWADEGPPIRIFYVPLIAFFISLGLGGLSSALIHDRPAEPEALIALYSAGLCLLITEGVHRRRRRIALHMYEVMRDGVRTEGRITGVDRFRINEEAMSRVTVAFNDQCGRQRLARDVISGHLVIGQKVDIRYLPSRVDRPHGVIIARRY